MKRAAIPVRSARRPQQRVEWPGTLTTGDLRELGWKPRAFDQFVLKIHSRCNLACDYCYIYEMSDTSWSDQDSVMSVEVATKAAQRIAEHAKKHNVQVVSIVLHGGEPLLAGQRRLREIFEVIERTLAGITVPRFSIQTNGLLLDSAMVELLTEFDAEIGVSLDGGRVANDRHRRRRNGSGSFDVVAGNIRHLVDSAHSSQLRGILAVIDLANDPVETYFDLLEFGAPKIDFLLPLAHWDEPPVVDGGADASYADWLIEVFDYWFHAPDEQPSIRLFDSIIRRIHDMSSLVESIGVGNVDLITVQTDGTYELVDTLKSTFDGAAEIGCNIFDDDLDALVSHPSVAVRQLGVPGLCETCRGCSIVPICGGGYYPHRYRQGSGFLNPSVYCDDLFKLVSYIQNAIAR